MKHFLFLFFCLLAFSSYSLGQTDTTVPKKDTAMPVPAVADSNTRPSPVKRRAVSDSLGTERDSASDSATVPGPVRAIRRDTAAAKRLPLTPAGPAEPITLPPVPDFNRMTAFQQVLQKHPYFNFFGRSVILDILERKSYGKEGLFYFLLILLLYYAFIRIFFNKYLQDLFTLFFRVTMRHQQIREQLLQSPLPSLLLNLLFLISCGFYIALVAIHYQFIPEADRWLVSLYSMGVLAAVYTGKFILLKVGGWIFNVQGATDTYTFIVFLVNKMLGILLLPVLLILAFAPEGLFSVVLSLSYVMIVVLFIYRFIISFRPLRNEIKINRFQFFMYLCAFEIAPLLLIYKVLLAFVERVY